jgi:hypothetical protein
MRATRATHELRQLMQSAQFLHTLRSNEFEPRVICADVVTVWFFDKVAVGV